MVAVSDHKGKSPNIRAYAKQPPYSQSKLMLDSLKTWGQGWGERTYTCLYIPTWWRKRLGNALMQFTGSTAELGEVQWLECPSRSLSLRSQWLCFLGHLGLGSPKKKAFLRSLASCALQRFKICRSFYLLFPCQSSVNFYNLFLSGIFFFLN